MQMAIEMSRQGARRSVEILSAIIRPSRRGAAIARKWSTSTA